MADNTSLNAMTGGDTLATDDIGGGVKVARGKLGFGVDGSYVDVSSSNPLPVNFTNTTIAVTNAGTFAAQAAQSGTWTVQPGNTANTTAWLVTGTGGTFPATQSGTWNVGTVTTLTGITNALPAGTNTIGYVNSVAAGDTIEIAGTTYTVKAAFANATTSGNTTVVAAVASKKIRVLAFSIGPVSAAVNVYFNNATNGAICSTKYLGANGGMGRALNHFGHFTTGTVNEDLRVNLSTAANVGVDVLYVEV